MRITPYLSLTSVLFIVSGCAAIVEGSGQNIRVKTADQQPSNCVVSNARGTSSVVVPTSVTVKRSKTDLNVRCTDTITGMQGEKTVKSDLENWFWGDIVLLSPLGVFIDAVSGAMWEYPKDVIVPLSGQPAYSQPAPQVYSAPVTQSYNAPSTQPYVAPQAPTSYVVPQPAMATPGAAMAPAPYMVIPSTTPALSTYYAPASPQQ